MVAVWRLRSNCPLPRRRCCIEDDDDEDDDEKFTAG
jgi:hypothetical protein